MPREYDDQIHVTYGVGERSILNCILATFKDKINFQMECGVNFYSGRVVKNDINRVPKSHMHDSISRNVLLLPYETKHCISTTITVVGDDHTVLRQDPTIGLPEFCIDLYNQYRMNNSNYFNPLWLETRQIFFGEVPLVGVDKS